MFQGFFFNQDDKALHGFSNFFRKRSDEKREHAQKVMEYQNNRGGVNVLQDVKIHPVLEVLERGILEAVKNALNLEKDVINGVRKTLDFTPTNSFTQAIDLS